MINNLRDEDKPVQTNENHSVSIYIHLIEYVGVPIIN